MVTAGGVPRSEPRSARPKYQLLMELGSGGMAVVHLAMSRGPQGFVKLFVLKMLKHELLGSSSAIAMFLEEARLSARLAHANVVQVYEILDVGGVPAMVMEYLEGQPLSALQAGGARLSLAQHLHVLTKLLSGLHAAHELRDYDGTPLNLVHRDVSPQNVFVLYDGQVKVLDFGIAKAANSSVQTQSGVMKGKIRYMAPEQLTGEETDRRADVFAAGVMLWEALAGRRLWGELPEGDVLVQLLTHKIPELPQELDIPESLRRTCRQALSPHRDGRQPTAAALCAEIDRHLASAELRCTPEDLGAHVRAAFAETRDKTQRLIDGAVKAAELASARPPPASNDTTSTAPAPARANQARPRRVALFVALGVAGFALALLLVLRPWRSAANDAPPSASSSVADVAPTRCGAGTKACGGSCVSHDRPDYGCASNACFACAIPNATPRCNASGQCDIAVCYRGFEDCDKNAANGCEVDVRTSPDHCGGCSRTCPELAHAERGCGDVCTIWRCALGYRDCNGQPQDGCEVEVSSDRGNCGHCGARCPPGQKCEAGRCSG